MKLAKTMTGKVLMIMAVVVVIAIVAIKNMKVPEVSLAEIDFSTITDGTYRGSYVLGPVKASVEVDVASGTVADIRIVEHRTGQGKAAEKITDSVIQAQSLHVDVISGATWSSKTLLKAIENALIGSK